VNIYQPITYSVNNVGVPMGQQKDVNTNPVLATYDYLVYNIFVDVPNSGTFNENVTLEFEAQGDASPPCVGENFNVTFNVKGNMFPNTFVSGLPPGWIAEWNSTGVDATETDSGPNGDMLVIGTADHIPIVATNVTPNLLTPQALRFDSMTGAIDPATGKSYINFDWATNAPEASPTDGTIHYILVDATGKKSPWVCNTNSITSSNQVVPGCTGYNSAPTYIIQNFYVDGVYTPFFMIETGYSGAGSFANASLITFDNYEGTSVNKSTSVTFYAYYYNNSSSTDYISPSAGGSCWIEFDDSWGDYKENGDATSCSGNWNGAQPCANVYDGNWGTWGAATIGAEAYYYVNYTKPVIGTAAAKWQIEDRGLTQNLTVPNSCLIGSELQFFVLLNMSNSQIEWYCWNSSDAWNRLYTSIAGSGTRMYEEGVYWLPEFHNMTVWNGTHYSYTKSDGFTTEAIHKWNVTCNDSTGTFATVQDVQDDVNVSGIRPCALDPDCDIACGGAGTGYTNDDMTCYSNSGCSAVCTGTCLIEPTCDSACSPYYGFSPDSGVTCYPSFYCLEECSAEGPGTPSYPEFSDFAWVLAVVLGAGGFVLMRRMRNGF
jgi:hypothetical protein